MFPKELDADFNIPTIHLMSNGVDQIGRDGAVSQYSADSHKQANKTTIMDGWNASNHNFNYLPQVFTFHCHILCFGIRELSLQAVTKSEENRAATYNVLPSGVDVATPLGSKSYAKPEFMEPQYLPNGKHHDAIIRDI